MKIPHSNVQHFFVDLIFLPQKVCTFTATLNKCNFWGTFWRELCVQECYSVSMSVYVPTPEHESDSMEKHVHDIDWSWMRHFLNPTLCIVWWSSIPFRELNYTKNFNNEGNLTSLSHFRIWFKMVYLVSKLTMTFNFLFPQFPTCDLPHGEPRAILSFLFAFSKSQMRIVQTGTALNR